MNNMELYTIIVRKRMFVKISYAYIFFNPQKSNVFKNIFCRTNPNARKSLCEEYIRRRFFHNQFPSGVICQILCVD